jgi:hypothetical protein
MTGRISIVVGKCLALGDVNDSSSAALTAWCPRCSKLEWARLNNRKT